MEDFNRFEAIAWSRVSGEPALRTLVESPDLGLVGIVREREDEPLFGYFVLTWGFDLEWNGRDAVLTELYLSPSARGRGLGDVVMDRAEAMARGEGARALHLLVRHENAPARRLYEKRGFIHPGRLFLTKKLEKVST